MKRVLVLLLAMIMIFALVGCNNNAENQPTPEKTQPTEPSVTDQTEGEPILIWIPGDEKEYAYYFSMFENYKAKVEADGGTFNYTIEQQPWGDYWTKLPLEVNNGRGPDLFYTHMAYSDILVPLAKELDFDQATLDKFENYELYTNDSGKPVLIPTTFVCKIMYANADVVGEMPEYPTTWEDFTALAKQYTDKQKGVIGFDYSFHLLWDLGYQNGKTITDANGAVTFDGVAQSLETLKKWQDEGFTEYLQYGNGSPEDALYQGSAAFIYGEPWMEFWAPSDVKTIAFPVPGGKTHNFAELTFGINKNVSGEKYKTLNDFVKFMLTDEKTITDIVKGNSGYPNNKDIKVTYEPNTAGAAVLKTFEAGNTNLAVPPSGLENVYKTMLESVLTGTSVEDAIAEAKINVQSVDVAKLKAMEDKFRDKIAK